MGELRRLKVGALLIERVDANWMSNEDIDDLLNRAHSIGLDLGPGSPLEDLTLGELNILVQDTGLPN